MSRVVKSAPNSEAKMSVQDQKIAALTRHGDLKITRKHMPANSVRFMSNEHYISTEIMIWAVASQDKFNL